MGQNIYRLCSKVNQVIYSSSSINLPSFKLLAQEVLRKLADKLKNLQRATTQISHVKSKESCKVPVKFQKDWPKTVGGVADTRQILPIHICSIKA